MASLKWTIVFTIFAVLFLGGAKCVFVADSGGSHAKDDTGSTEQQDSGLLVVIRSGRFIDAPVQGLRYESGGLHGITGADGSFSYPEGQAIRFSIGDIELGTVHQAQPLVTPLDLVNGGGLHTATVINIARLLQSLDAIPGDNRITLPASLNHRATRSNRRIAAALEFLDFSDDVAFVNSASQLVASLTAEYAFTASLVDAETARAHLEQSLRAAGMMP